MMFGIGGWCVAQAAEGEFVVSPGQGLIATTLIGLLVVGWVLWRVIRIAKQPPRFIRVGRAITGVARVVFAAYVVVSLLGALSGDLGGAGSGRALRLDGSTLHARVGVDRAIETQAPDAARALQLQAEYGRDVRIEQAKTVEFVINDPSTLQRGILILLVLLGQLAILGGLQALWILLSRAEQGEAFTQPSLRALRGLAAAFLVGGTVVQLVEFFFLRSLVTSGGGARPDLLDAGIALTPIAIAALLLALAEIWRHAIELQREVAATI